MIALLSLLLAVNQPAGAAAVNLPAPPANWSELPLLALNPPPAELRTLSTYVKDEVRAGRCAATGPTLHVSLALLIEPRGSVRRVVPRAIDCPTVEQYAAGLASRLARGRIVAPPPTDTWYRASIAFSLR